MVEFYFVVAVVLILICLFFFLFSFLSFEEIKATFAENEEKMTDEEIATMVKTKPDIGIKLLLEK